LLDKNKSFFGIFVCERCNVGTPPAMHASGMWRCTRGAAASSPLRGEKTTLHRDPLFVARSQLFVFVIGKNAEGVIKALFPRRMHFLFISRRAVLFFWADQSKKQCTVAPSCENWCTHLLYFLTAGFLLDIHFEVEQIQDKFFRLASMLVLYSQYSQVLA
jgi:hypothetical protein